MDVAIFPEGCIDVVHNIAGNRETDSFATTRLRENERVDSNQRAICVHQRTAAIAGIDRRVGLYINSWIIVGELTRYRADNAHTHGVIHSQRTAERQDEFTLFEFQ